MDDDKAREAEVRGVELRVDKKVCEGGWDKLTTGLPEEARVMVGGAVGVKDETTVAVGGTVNEVNELAVT